VDLLKNKQIWQEMKVLSGKWNIQWKIKVGAIMVQKWVERGLY
jgi:hypothetical protein